MSDTSGLRTAYLGLDLRSPIVASAGPLTGDVETLVALEQAGIAAVVLPSLFEEQIERDTQDIDRVLDRSGDPSTAPLDLDDYNAGVDRYLELIEAAKSSVDIPVIASLNGANIGGWLRYARSVESAGADAIELNLYTVEADPIVSSTSVESEQFGLISLLVAELNIPVSVKISPYYSALGSFVVSMQEAGASGVVLFNRFYQPDLDPDSREVTSQLELSTSRDHRLALRWIGLLRDHVSMSIAASSGIHTGRDAAKLILAGADVVMMTSALLRSGTSHVATVEAELREWMISNSVASLDDVRGSATAAVVADPAAYERANYIGAVATASHDYLDPERFDTP